MGFHEVEELAEPLLEVAPGLGVVIDVEVRIKLPTKRSTS